MYPIRTDIWNNREQRARKEITMTADVQQLLLAFDALTLSEKQEAAVEVLRRLSAAGPRDLTDETLTACADALFADLDAREADHAGP